MDESYSESDVSLSPSQILERLQVLRELQLMQRGKLQKQCLQFKETSETSTSMTEIVSHFSSSTSYNTFRSLLQSTSDILNEASPQPSTSNLSQKVQEQDLIEGVSVLNLSQESEFIISSPLSNRSKTSASSRRLETLKELQNQNVSNSSQNMIHNRSVSSSVNDENNITLTKKQITLDDMPILSPKNNFEQLLLEKLKDEASAVEVKRSLQKISVNNKSKKPFLRRGEGIARFGLKKNSIIIQNTKSLPWRRKSFNKSLIESPLRQVIKNKNTKIQSNLEPLTSDLKESTINKKDKQYLLSDKSNKEAQQQDKHSKKIDASSDAVDNLPKKLQLRNESTASRCDMPLLKTMKKLEFARNTHPLITNKAKTWAAVLTKEQSEFLRELKQSEYYKNFASPTKSVTSNISYDETMCNLRQERDKAEQNMFDLLENKVSHDSFNLENSFFKRFLKKSNIECSGESTPLVMQKCLSDNPDLMHLLPALRGEERNEESHSDVETCCSYTDCCSDTCSSVSCCSCKTLEQSKNRAQKPANLTKNKKSTEEKSKNPKKSQKEVCIEEKSESIVTEDVTKENIAEMNAKLIATSELLKDRLHELEDEIDTFRKENANLAKLREEIDQDKHKFYQEKSAFEQKFNEDKVLAEYYLAEEKDKLSKQKQMYDRYVRELRGRLNKKDKDEVLNLKKEITDMKEEIRIKDVKSTSIIARLRNQIKMMEKEKKELHDEVEKLKKENKRIRHNNDVTRRLTNIKYLEQINKKLTNMSSKDTKSEVNIDHDMKYKAYEIERQSRCKKVPHAGIIRPLPRAKSVPNLNVTSRYAKYFSQRDAVSQIDQNGFLNVQRYNYNPENDCLSNNRDSVFDKSIEDNASSENDDYIEKNYIDTFKTISPKGNRSCGSYSDSDNNMVDKTHLKANTNDFFIQKTNSARNSRSPLTLSPSFDPTDDSNRNWTKSPISISSKCINPSSNSTAHLSSHSSSNYSHKRSQSPVSAFNHSSLQPVTVIHNNQYGDKLMTVSPEPVVSKTSLTKTNLNPTELRKPDGSRELRFPNGNVKILSSDGKYSKFIYYNGDVKENFYDEGRIKYYYAETKTYHTTHADGLEVLEFPDGQVEKRYKDGSSEIRLPNGGVRYFDPKNKHIREEWRFPDGAALTVAANGERRIVFSNGQIEVHAQDHKRREFPDGTVKLVYNDGTSETRYASGRVRIKDKHGNLIMDSAPS